MVFFARPGQTPTKTYSHSVAAHHYTTIPAHVYYRIYDALSRFLLLTPTQHTCVVTFFQNPKPPSRSLTRPFDCRQKKEKGRTTRFAHPLSYSLFVVVVRFPLIEPEVTASRDDVTVGASSSNSTQKQQLSHVCANFREFCSLCSHSHCFPSARGVFPGVV